MRFIFFTLYLIIWLASVGMLTAVSPVVTGPFFNSPPQLFTDTQPAPAADTPSPLLTVAEQAAASTVTVIGNTFGEGSVGSGFFISPDGLVVTSAHVVDKPRAHYSIITAQGKRFEVEEIIRSTTNDIALLKTAAANTASLSLAATKHVTAGEAVATVGPGAGWVASSGRVVGTDRNVITDIQTIERDVIQVETLVRPGSSGGPLLNGEGEVVGVVFAFSLENPSMGFAIPAARVETLVQQSKAPRQPVVLQSVVARPELAL